LLQDQKMLHFDDILKVIRIFWMLWRNLFT